MKIFILGGSGFIGTYLTRFLKDKYDVYVFTRKKSLIDKGQKEFHYIFWDGKVFKNNALSFFKEKYVIINLSGFSILKRWTKKNKNRILSSRIDSVNAINEAMTKVVEKPVIIIQASAIGYYGHRPEEEITENYSKGSGFLANVNEKCEEVTKEINTIGIPIVIVRLGIVLSLQEGYLKVMAGLIKRRLGVISGSGKQYISWIAIDDVVSVISFFIENRRVQKVYNLVAPNAIMNKEFMIKLGKKLHRKVWIKVPSVLLQFVLGERARELILIDQKVIPEALFREGFNFKYCNFDDLLNKYF